VSNTRFGNIRLPFRLPGLCPLRVSVEVALPMPSVSSQRFQDRLVFTIPPDPALVGASMFTQWMTFDGLSLLASSRGAQIDVGR
jgi:hypothetical protein